MAAGEVNSNIVGYTTKGVDASKKLLSGAQFVEVGKGGLDLASIKLEGVDPDSTTRIQWWNGTGYDQAAWLEIDDNPNNIGWGDFLSWEGVSHTFDPGEGFWILMSANVSSPKVTQAGEVALSEANTYDFPLAASKKFMVINPLPTDILLSDIMLIGVDPDSTTRIQWWNGTGYDQAAWLEIDDNPNNIGWGDFLSWEGVSHKFVPGDGFWITVSGNVTAPPQVKIVNQVL